MERKGASLFLVYLALVWVSIFQLITAKKHEYPVKALTHDILDRYLKLGPGLPMNSNRDAVEVKFGTSLQHILEVDLKGETITTLLWYNFEWKDPTLQWNESDYNGVQSIRLKPSDIYTPDIMPYNSVPGRTHRLDTDIVVYSSGLCNWVPVVTLTTSCSAPSEKILNHSCHMKFGSWTFDGTKLNLTTMSDKVDTSTYTENQEWKLLDAPAKRYVKTYDCCPEPYISIDFILNLQHSGAEILQHPASLLLVPALWLTYQLTYP